MVLSHRSLERPRSIPASSIDTVCDVIGDLCKVCLYAAIDVPRRLSSTTLTAALQRLSLAEPALAARYVRGRRRSRWVLDDEPTWEVAEHDVTTEPGAEDIEASLVAAPFSRTGELPLRLELLHLEDRDRLLLRVSHILVDGGGMKNLMYQLATAYRELEADRTWQPIHRLGGPRDGLRLLGALRLGSTPAAVSGLIEDTLSFIPRSCFFVPMEPVTSTPNRLETRVVPLRLDKNRVDQLRERWKPQGATLNDLFLAALSRALESRFGDAPGQHDLLGLTVTSDLRKHLPPEDHFCNLSNVRAMELGRLPLPPPLENLRNVRRAMSRWKRNLSGLGHSLFTMGLTWMPDELFRKVVRGIIGAPCNERRCRVGMTNIGPIDGQRLDFGGGSLPLDARIIPPVAYPPLLITGVTGYGGAVSFALGYCRPGLGQDDAEGLIQDLDDELRRLL